VPQRPADVCVVIAAAIAIAAAAAIAAALDIHGVTTCALQLLHMLCQRG
jgi:hypothetical protein